MRVLIDTNVILDVLLAREEFKDESGMILAMLEHGRCKGFVSATSVTDIYYISRKTFHDREKALSVIREMLAFSKILKADEKSIRMAVDLQWKDFEDSVQYAVAKRSRIGAIITRNTKDYSLSKIPVYTPHDFLALVG